jgi:hypothetical protein
VNHQEIEQLLTRKLVEMISKQANDEVRRRHGISRKDELWEQYKEEEIQNIVVRICGALEKISKNPD